MKIDKGQGVGAALSTIVSIGAVVPIVWFIIQPLLLKSLSAAMAQDTKAIVKSEVAPLNSAFRVIIEQNILELRRSIAQLERRQRTAEGLTVEETNNLVDLKAKLEAQEMALEGLK